MAELRFFIYGSMSQGQVHFDKVSNFISDIRPATILASAYKLKVGYPTLIDEPVDRVQGELVELKTLTTHQLLLTLLDQFHVYRAEDPKKCLHIRTEVDARVESGETITAQCYFYAKDKLPRSASPIPGGDWKASCCPKAVLPQKLTDRQKNYLARLGASIGREVIPIDLNLYRELMNLELIVDKGRRLALSPLGQELFRYL